LCHIKK
ncbi:Phosphate regulon sensor protein PhoR, partial [Haemophilus influenzae]